jgi:hypothetical protein
MIRKELNRRGGVFSPESPAVRGILNVTPDSFYAASRCADEVTAEDLQQIVLSRIKPDESHPIYHKNHRSDKKMFRNNHPF